MKFPILFDISEVDSGSGVCVVCGYVGDFSIDDRGACPKEAHHPPIWSTPQSMIDIGSAIESGLAKKRVPNE